MEEMQITSALTWIEVQFMKKAVEEVDKCRRTLKWTYSMAYYLAKGNEKELYEDNQRYVIFTFSRFSLTRSINWTEIWNVLSKTSRNCSNPPSNRIPSPRSGSP